MLVRNPRLVPEPAANALRRVSAEDWARFCREHDLRLLVLFGSQAKGHAGHQSDIDLAALSFRSGDDVDYQEGVWEDAVHLLRRAEVDLVWLHRAPPLLGHQVGTTGQVLYEATSGTWRDFVLLALKKHWDNRKLYDLQRESLRRFVEGHRHGE